MIGSLRSRRSTRDFLLAPVPPEVSDRIFEDARHCPSWSNMHPCVVAVASGEQLELLRASYGEAVETCLALKRRRPTASLKSLCGRDSPPATSRCGTPTRRTCVLAARRSAKDYTSTWVSTGRAEPLATQLPAGTWTPSVLRRLLGSSRARAPTFLHSGRGHNEADFDPWAEGQRC